MKLIINSIDDMKHIYGRFIIMVNHDNLIYLDELRPEAREFYFAKRIRFVSKSPYTPDDSPMRIVESDLWGNSFSYSTEDYLEHFNNPSKGTRFHRLLKGKELTILFDWMRERNY